MFDTCVEKEVNVEATCAVSADMKTTCVKDAIMATACKIVTDVAASYVYSGVGMVSRLIINLSVALLWCPYVRLTLTWVPHDHMALT